MKKLILLIAILSIAIPSVAQKKDGRTTVINGNQNFQGFVGGGVDFINGDVAFGPKVGINYNYKRLRLKGEYAYMVNGDIDRSSANVGFDYSITQNPNNKVRFYVGATVGGASQSAYSCYQTNVSGGNGNANANLEFIHVYKTYDWNFQARLGFQVDFVLSTRWVISVRADGIYNPKEGAQKWAQLGDVNFEAPEGQHFEVSVNNLENAVKATKFGVGAGFNVAFRF